MDQFRNEPGPAGLMRRPQPGTGITVKIFMEPIAIIAALLLPARALSISAPGPY